MYGNAQHPLTLLGSKIQLVFLPTDCHTVPRKLDMTFSVSSTQHPLADNLISSHNLFARKNIGIARNSCILTTSGGYRANAVNTEPQ